MVKEYNKNILEHAGPFLKGESENKIVKIVAVNSCIDNISRTSGRRFMFLVSSPMFLLSKNAIKTFWSMLGHF